MKFKQFREYVSLYGADWERWPSQLRAEAQSAVSEQNDFAELWSKEIQIQDHLQARRSLSPSPDLSERIIRAARSLPQIDEKSSSAISLLQSWRDLFRPRWALAFSFLLMLGFVSGYLLRFDSISYDSESELASLLNDQEKILWATNSSQP